MAENAASDGGMSGVGPGGSGRNTRGGGGNSSGHGGGDGGHGMDGGFDAGGFNGYGDRGPGGSSGDIGAWGGGATPSGPGTSSSGGGYGYADPSLNLGITSSTSTDTQPESAFSRFMRTAWPTLSKIPTSALATINPALAVAQLGLKAYDKFGTPSLGDGFGTATGSAGGGIGGGNGGGNGGTGLALGSSGTGGGMDATLAPQNMGELFDIFFAGNMAMGGGQFQAPAYAQDPSRLYGEALNSLGAYRNNFNDTYGLMRNQVQQFNDPEFMAQQRSRRMSDVQQQADAGYQAGVRERMRLGMNPNDGRMAAMSNQRAMQTALGKVQAAAQSDNELRGLYMNGLTSLAGMNNDYGKVGLGATTVGLDATKNLNNFNMAGAELGLKANGGTLDWAKMGMDKYRADKGLEGTKYSSDASNDVNWGALAAGSLLNSDGFWDWLS